MTETLPCYINVALPVPLPQSFTYLHSDPIPAGIRVEVTFAHRKLIGLVLEDHPIIDSTIDYKPIDKVIDNKPVVSSQWLALAVQASHYYLEPIGEALMHILPTLLREGRQISDFQQVYYQSKTDPNAPPLRAKKQQHCLELLKQGPKSYHSLKQAGAERTPLLRLIELGLVEEVAPSLPLPHQVHPSPHTLNEQQQNCVDAITQDTGFKVSVIDGVTGSGKTEVYLQAIEETLKQGLQILVLIPEISLTPQTISRFEKRFEAEIVVQHSGLASGQRLKNWVSAARGEAHIVIGTRSSVFTPMPRLGLIVIDEEHDTSFKQQEGFRYSGRDIAILRAKQLNIPVLLGSATPSLETAHNAELNRYHYYRLDHRAGNAQMPTINIIDTRQQTTQCGLTDEALNSLAQTRAQGFQSLVFINRRGYAPALQCQDCGWLADCAGCLRHFTIHQQHQRLSCHHCDTNIAIPHHCPVCRSSQFSAIGEGTERLEGFLSASFPDTKIIRIDRDTTKNQHQLTSHLEPIEAGEPAILVGTQMLAKGHHFERVTNVVIVDIDGGLYSSDPRASERMGQLLTQVTGRAGRAAHHGQVYIQSALPDHPLLTPLIQGDYHAFMALLMQERASFELPPYTFAAILRADHPHIGQVQQLLAKTRNTIEHLIPSSIRLEGPMPAPIEQRSGRYRGQLRIFGHRRKEVHQLCTWLSNKLHQQKLRGGLRWSIDIDPQDFS